jgi:hypothetical protein
MLEVLPRLHFQFLHPGKNSERDIAQQASKQAGCDDFGANLCLEPQDMELHPEGHYTRARYLCMRDWVDGAKKMARIGCASKTILVTHTHTTRNVVVLSISAPSKNPPSRWVVCVRSPMCHGGHRLVCHRVAGIGAIEETWRARKHRHRWCDRLPLHNISPFYER